MSVMVIFSHCWLNTVHNRQTDKNAQLNANYYSSEKETNCNNESNGDDSRAGHDSSTVWQQGNQRRHQRLGKHVELVPQSF